MCTSFSPEEVKVPGGAASADPTGDPAYAFRALFQARLCQIRRAPWRHSRPCVNLGRLWATRHDFRFAKRSRATRSGP